MSIKQALSIKQMKFTFKQGLNIWESIASKQNEYAELRITNVAKPYTFKFRKFTCCCISNSMVVSSI